MVGASPKTPPLAIVIFGMRRRETSRGICHRRSPRTVTQAGIVVVVLAAVVVVEIPSVAVAIEVVGLALLIVVAMVVVYS